MKLLFGSILLAASTLASSQAINPAVTQSNIRTTICVSGWTATIRPPDTYTTLLKLEQLAVMFPDLTPMQIRNTAKLYEEDHILPLSSGGHPKSPKNLEPQLWSGKYGAHAKDVIELKVHKDICLGKLTLAQGQEIFISGSWKTLVK